MCPVQLLLQKQTTFKVISSILMFMITAECMSSELHSACRLTLPYQLLCLHNLQKIAKHVFTLRDSTSPQWQGWDIVLNQPLHIRNETLICGPIIHLTTWHSCFSRALTFGAHLWLISDQWSRAPTGFLCWQPAMANHNILYPRKTTVPLSHRSQINKLLLSWHWCPLDLWR